MSLDYGKKRTGIAISDPLRIIASPVETVDTNELIGFIKKYIQIHEVDTFVVGYPLALDGNPTDATALVDKFLGKLQNVFPAKTIVKWDERFTSSTAQQTMHAMQLKKGQREQKGVTDRIAATIMLQEYLNNLPDKDS